MTTWLEVALNGPWSRGRQPLMPISVQAIVREGIACARAGAAIVHVHAYDERTGRQNDDVDLYVAMSRREALSPTSSHPRIIIHSPIPTNAAPAIRGSSCTGRTFAIAAPAVTPRAADKTNAAAAAKNTTQSDFPDWAANNTVASWVLSPSSARKTVANTVEKSFRSMGRRTLL